MMKRILCAMLTVALLLALLPLQLLGSAANSVCKEPDVSISQDGDVLITSPDEVHYTTDGSLPDKQSAVYSAPFEIEPGRTLTATAFSKDGSGEPSAAVILRYTERRNVFSDVFENAWYYNYADYAVEQQLIVGTGEYRFSPDKTLSRAMLVTVLYRLAGEPTAYNWLLFPDVKEGEWYSEAVKWAEQEGIISGYSDGRFHPNDAVTREQTAAALLRYCLDCSFDCNIEDEINKFSDKSTVSAYAREAMAWAVTNEIIVGNAKGELSPRKPISRAEFAALLQRYIAQAETWTDYRLSDENLLALSDRVIEVMRAGEMEELAAFIHPTKGLTFTPFCYVEDNNRTISAAAFAAAAKDVGTYYWGAWDASGEDILLTFDEYWERFVWNCDYTQADNIGINRIICNSITYENLFSAYPGCLFVDYYVASSMGYHDNTDWSSLKLVFLRSGGDWYLTAIVHGEVTF